MTEKHLAELRAIGDRFHIPYAYTEWLGAIRAIHAANARMQISSRSV